MSDNIPSFLQTLSIPLTEQKGDGDDTKFSLDKAAKPLSAKPYSGPKFRKRKKADKKKKRERAQQSSY